MEINKLTSTGDRSSNLREADSKQPAGATNGVEAESLGRNSGSDAADGLSVPTQVQLSSIAQGLADAAEVKAQTSDVDLNRVQEIRSAIEQGTYHVDPARLAANFVDLEHQLFG